MKFIPKTQEEIDAANLCEEGDFPFTIKEASEGVSKKGAPMFKVKVIVHGDNNRDWHVYDYVSPAFMEHRLLHLCEATGLFPQYSKGELTADDLIDRQGHCSVGIAPANDGYPAKNIIEDYIVKNRKEAMAENKAKATATPAPLTPKEDDDVPF